MPRIVAGIDPGLDSLAIAVLRDGRLSYVYQYERPKKERTPTDKDVSPWIDELEKMLVNEMPQACGLENVEHQPWKANGKTPKGVVSLRRLVDEMQTHIAIRGVIPYRQSPDIQGGYSNAVVDRMIHNACGEDFEILPHLRSAMKHALEADAMYQKAMKARQTR